MRVFLVVVVVVSRLSGCWSSPLTCVCIMTDWTTTPIQHTLGDTQYVIPLCVTLMAARWVGNFFNEGAYVRACMYVWVSMRRRQIIVIL